MTRCCDWPAFYADSWRSKLCSIGPSIMCRDFPSVFEFSTPLDIFADTNWMLPVSQQRDQLSWSVLKITWMARGSEHLFGKPTHHRVLPLGSAAIVAKAQLWSRRLRRALYHRRNRAEELGTCIRRCDGIISSSEIQTARNHDAGGAETWLQGNASLQQRWLKRLVVINNLAASIYIKRN